MAREEYILDAEGKDLVRILPGGWRNFKGQATQFNAAGNRSFNVAINDISLVQTLRERGFNVKEYVSKDNPDNEPLRYLQIKLKFNAYGPDVVQYVQGNSTGIKLDEDTIGELDDAEIVDCAIKIRPYDWTMKTGNKGTTAYLSELLVQVSPNRFAERFENPLNIEDARSTF